jgi:outer membrane protein assembly factor BamB
MLRFLLFSFSLLAASLEFVAGAADFQTPARTNAIDVAATDWPWWRGPNRNGIATAGQTPPLRWSESENLVWKAAVPGRGHGSPTVQGDRVFLATADETAETQSVLCYDRKTGKRLWKTDVHKGGLKAKNKKASLASASVACDGQRLFINFFNAGAVYTTALSRDGKQLWQTKITDYVVHQGFASSPAVYRSLVIVSADNKGGGAIAGLQRDSGKIVWKHDRPTKPNYASPIILQAGGREQLLFTGCDIVSSFEPLTGAKLWEVEGSTTECVTSIVTDGERVFTSGGYPDNHVSALLADGSAKLVWENKVRVYVPSMVVQDGYLYAVTDAGVAMCWNSENGKEIWRGRLGGTFSSSPVLAGGHIFATNERGQTFVFKASPSSFDLVAKNQLGRQVFATPAICGSRIYARAASVIDGRRQESLYCIGTPSR